MSYQKAILIYRKIPKFNHNKDQDSIAEKTAWDTVDDNEINHYHMKYAMQDAIEVAAFVNVQVGMGPIE
jgi:hypothetical protein